MTVKMCSHFLGKEFKTNKSNETYQIEIQKIVE